MSWSALFFVRIIFRIKEVIKKIAGTTVKKSDINGRLKIFKEKSLTIPTFKRSSKTRPA